MARSALYPPSVKPGIPKLGSKPKGWIETTFGDVLQVVQRPAEIADEVEYQLVTAKRARGGIVPRDVLQGKKILTKVQYYVAGDDFLISKRQIVHGACGVVPSNLSGAIVSGEYSVLRVKNGLLLKYLDYFSHTDYFQMSCFQASVGVDVEKMIFDLREWLKVKVYLPPIEEQKRIVEILSTWDKAIFLGEKIVTSKLRFKKGLMQQLLSGKKRFPTYKKYLWHHTTLGDQGSFIRGVSYNPEADLYSSDTKDSIRLLRANNIRNERINLDDVQYVSKSKVANLQKMRLNDIAICMASGSKDLVGKTAMFRVNDNYQYTVGAFCAIFRANDASKQDFIGYYFQSDEYKKNLLGISAGSNINNLRSSELAKFSFLIPSAIEEQKAIYETLNNLDKEIDILTQMVYARKMQRKGLMQKFLTGQIRVKV